MHGVIPLYSLSVSMTYCTSTVCLGHPDYVGGGNVWIAGDLDH
jgi:hypothetical protein